MRVRLLARAYTYAARRCAANPGSAVPYHRHKARAATAAVLARLAGLRSMLRSSSQPSTGESVGEGESSPDDPDGASDMSSIIGVSAACVAAVALVGPVAWRSSSNETATQ